MILDSYLFFMEFVILERSFWLLSIISSRIFCLLTWTPIALHIGSTSLRNPLSSNVFRGGPFFVTNSTQASNKSLLEIFIVSAWFELRGVDLMNSVIGNCTLLLLSAVLFFFLETTSWWAFSCFLLRWRIKFSAWFPVICTLHNRQVFFFCSRR